MNEIFLSYRRADEPGYVGRLADSLERAFGTDTVYRDVDSTRAGSNWKKSITRSVSGASVVVAVIGPAWQELLASWTAEDRDWVRHELNQAHDLDIPVIPVKVANAQFDYEQDLGDLAWLTDLQFFYLADGQDGWERDIAGLIDTIASATTLKIMARNEDRTGLISQVSHGSRSPNIDSGGGPVNVTYGVPQKVADRLNELLDAKDIALVDREARLTELTERYHELQTQLAERDDDLVRRTRELLTEGQLDEAEELLKGSLTEHLKRLDENRDLAAAEASELGGIRLLNLDYAGGRDYYAQAVELSPRNSVHLNELGWVEFTLANYDKAIDCFEQALSIDREVHGKRDPRVALDLNNLGAAWRSLGQYDKAVDCLEQALSIDREVYGDRHSDVARDLSNLGTVWHSLGQYDKAIDYYEQALSIYRELYGERHAEVANTLNNLGEARRQLGQYDKAIDCFEQALSIDREVCSERHPELISRLNNLGEARRQLGQYDKAIDYYEQALSIGREAYGESHPHVATCLNNLGLAWDSLSQYDKAIDYHEQALSIDREVYGDRHSDVARDLSNLGLVRDSLGQYDKAIDLYQQALSIYRELNGDRHSGVTLNNLGAACGSLGQYDKAIDYYEQALSIDREVYSERHPEVATCLSNLGGAWFLVGQYDKAIDYYEQALSIFRDFFGLDHSSTITVTDNLKHVLQSVDADK